MIIVAIHLIIDNSNMVHIKEINGVIIAKTITLETLLEKLQEALQSNNTVSTPYLPINTVKYQKINEAYRIAIFYPATTRPYNYHGHVFKDTPFPNLLFIFTVQDKRITDARVAAVRDLVMRSTTKLYRYPYSHILVMEIHSHHKMPAKFSSIDNEEQKETILFAVVGSIDKFFPDITVRASCAGKYIPVDPGDVFESPNASLTDWIPNSYPSCWDESITVTKVGNNKKHMEGKARCSILGRHTYGDNRRFF